VDGTWISVAQMNWSGPPPEGFSLSYPIAGVERTMALGSGEVHLRALGGAGRPEHFVVDLPFAAPVQLAIYDVLGRRIRTLLSGRLPRGPTAVMWDGSGTAASGMYFARLTCPGGGCALKFVLCR